MAITLTIYLGDTEQVVTTYTDVNAVTINENGSFTFIRRRGTESYGNIRNETFNFEANGNHIVIDRPAPTTTPTT